MSPWIEFACFAALSLTCWTLLWRVSKLEKATEAKSAERIGIVDTWRDTAMVWKQAADNYRAASETWRKLAEKE